MSDTTFVIAALVVFAACEAIMILFYLHQHRGGKLAKFLRRITHPLKKVTNEATNEQFDPMYRAEIIGKYRVALQYDKATGTDRWIVDQLLIAKSGARAEVRRADYPTREQALAYARGYASEPTHPPEHPLPDRRAAIEHTRALS